MSPRSDFLRLSLPADSYRGLAGYLRESRRPLTSLAFVLPLLAAYEVGILVIPTTMRNGADAWMRRLLDLLGFGGYFLLPCLTISVLLAWHHVLREPWRTNRKVLVGMLAESATLGALLIGVARLHGAVFAASAGGWTPSLDGTSPGRTAVDLAGQIVAFCGAGLYEEVLFRLLLVPVFSWLASIVGARDVGRLALAIVSTSLLFSLAHYIGTSGDTWDLYSFVFRFTAGLFFALLFVYRGFGITAGTHALYDMLIGVEWA